MKKFVLLLLVIIPMFMNGQVTKADLLSGLTIQDSSNCIAILDSTVTPNVNHQIAQEKLFGTNGVIENINKQISREKVETGEIKHKEALTTFAQNLQQSYINLLLDYLVVDTVLVDTVVLNSKLSSMSEWLISMENDPDVRKADWDDVLKEYNKYLMYDDKVKKEKEKLKE